MTSQFMLPLGGLSLLHLFLSFAGGIFGAAVGALPAFILCSFFVIIGVVLMVAGAGPDFLLTLGLGYTFGPHACFGAAVCAHAYAHKKQLSPGRDITAGLMGLKSPDVLLVGGLFGMLSAVLAWIFLTLLPFKWNGMHWTDGLAISITIMGIIARLMFSKSGLFGKVAEGERRYRPTEKSLLWIPWQMTVPENVVIGLGVGLLASYLALLLGPEKGGLFLGFGISGFSLVFLQFGTKMPVTHHISLIAAGAAIASGSLIWGTLFGIGAALAGHFWACTLTIHADTYIDPPAATIFSMWSVMVALGALGVYKLIPLP